jgi:hypothetical protein
MRVDDLQTFSGKPEQLQRLLDRQQALRTESQTKPNELRPKTTIPKHHPGEKFVRGPIPFDWLQPALALGGKAGNLAWAIWFRAGIERQNPIKLTGRTLRDFHISPRAARRLLRDFEKAGLVQVDQKRGRGPMVTLLPQTKENPAKD